MSKCKTNPTLLECIPPIIVLLRNLKKLATSTTFNTNKRRRCIFFGVVHPKVKNNYRMNKYGNTCEIWEVFRLELVL